MNLSTLWIAVIGATESTPDTSLSRVLTSKEVVAALIGATLGGLLTYLATARLERRKEQRVESSLSNLVLIEVLDHLAAVEFALDRVLPHWLKRKRATYGKNYLLENTSVLSSKLYEQFSGMLAMSKLGPLLNLYYSRVAEYNRYATNQPQEIPTESLHNYVGILAAVIEIGIDVVDEVRRTRGARQFKDKRFRGAFVYFDEHRRRCRLMASLCRTSEAEILNLINNKQNDWQLPEILATTTAEELQPWLQM